MTLRKPLGRKAYGSISHLPESRLGKGDHHCSHGQARICTTKVRDKHDSVIVQEKLDGSNTAVAKLNKELLPLGRSGYLANSSPYKQHQMFSNWVFSNHTKFNKLLKEGERCCGEWLYQAHGTRYKLKHAPFVIFDIFDKNNNRIMSENVKRRCSNLGLITPHELYRGNCAYSIEDALKSLGTYGYHGALEQVEGAVWRVERNGKVDFLAKYVRQDKVDGCYLDKEIYNVNL